MNIPSLKKKEKLAKKVKKRVFLLVFQKSDYLNKLKLKAKTLRQNSELKIQLTGCDRFQVS